MKTFAATLAAFALLTGAAIAQTTPADAPAKTDPIAKKFSGLDADKSGFLEGKELETLKEKLTFLDMDKDGKVSPQEFNVGVMTGVLK